MLTHRKLYQGYEGTSIKTRIETFHTYNGCVFEQIVMKEHPLKQGLKLAGGGMGGRAYAGYEGTSIKTRIETVGSEDYSALIVLL